VGYTEGSGGRYLLVGDVTMRVWAQGAISPGGGVHYEGVFHGMRLRDVIGVMLIRIAIRDICRGLYSGLRGAISPGGGVHYEGAFHGMRLRAVIGVMLIRISIRDICRGLFSGLRGQYLPVGPFTTRLFP
jgi:hypothetical protein